MRVRADVRAVVGRPDFIPTGFDRLYGVPEIDGWRYSVNSLRALLKVLDALRQASGMAKEETHGE